MKGSIAIVSLVTVLCALRALASPTGAPALACTSMTPNHGPGGEGPAPVPFTVITSANTASPGTPLIVNLEATSTDRPFKGFMLMARASDSSSTEPVGSFSFVNNNGKTLDCSYPGSTVTHANNTIRTTVQASWDAPANYQGSVTFLATFVEYKELYYAKVASAPVLVSP